MTVKTTKGQYFQELTDGPRSNTFDYEGTAELARARQEKMRVSKETLEELVAVIRDFESAPNVLALIELATREEQAAQ